MNKVFGNLKPIKNQKGIFFFFKLATFLFPNCSITELFIRKAFINLRQGNQSSFKKILYSV